MSLTANSDKHGPIERDPQSSPGTSSAYSGGMPSIPGFGDISSPAQDKPAAPPESSQPKCSSKSAAEVLKHFGLDAEDLDYIISYPEDQITPDNLPLILQEVRNAKSKRAASAGQPGPFAESHPTRSESGMDGQGLSSFGGAGKSGAPASDFPSSTDAMQPIAVQTPPPSTRQPLAKVSPVSKDHPSATSSLSSSGGTENPVPPASDFPSFSDAMKPVSIQTPPPSNQQPLAKVSPVSRDPPTANIHHPTATSSLSSSGGAGVCPRELPPAVLQLGEVTGHTSKYGDGFGNEIVSTSSIRADSGGSGSTLLKNTPISSRHSRESVQKTVRELKKIVLGFSRGQTISDSTLSSSDCSTLSSAGHSSNDLTTQSQTHPRQTSQSIISSFYLPKTDKDAHVPECTTPKPAILKKQPEVVNPSQPGRVTVDKNDASVAEDPSKIKEQGSIPEQAVTQHTQQQQKQPVSLTRETIRPPACPASYIIQPIPTKTLPPSNRRSAKDVPIALKLQDCAATTPRSFPHTCSLCDEECLHLKHWIDHLNTSLHRFNCQAFRKEAPGRKERGRREKRSSRSRSPQSSRRNRRSWSSSSSSSGSSSSSPERQSSQRRRDEKRSPLGRGNLRRSPPRRKFESESQTKRIEKRRSPPRRSDRGRTPPRRSDRGRTPPRRSDRRRTPPRMMRPLSPRRSEKTRSPPRRSERSQSPPRTSAQSPSLQENKSNTAEILAKKILEASAAQSLSTPPELQNVAKLLVPAILGEITKMASSATSSTSTAFSSPPPAPPLEAKKKFAKKLPKAKPSQETSEATSPMKLKSGKSSPPTMVKLQGIDSSVSRDDVLDAVENYGKTKSCLLFRAKREASVFFEKEEDAKRLRSINSFDVKDTTIIVVKEQAFGEASNKVDQTISKEQQTPLQKKPTMSSVSTSQGTTTANVSLPQSNLHLSKKTNVSRELMTSENKVQEAMPKDTSEAVEKTLVTAFKPELQADHDEATKAEVPEPEMEIGEMGVLEPLEDGDFAEFQEEETTALEEASENSSSAKSLKQHLQQSSEITINLEPNSISVKAEPQTVKIQSQPPTSELFEDGSQPFLQTSGQGDSTISESITTGPSATSDAVMKENEDVEKADIKEEEGSLATFMSNASTSPTSSATVSITAMPAAVEIQIQIQPSSAGQLDDGTQSSLQTSGQGDSTISESITTGPSATSDAVMKENEDAEEADVKGEEGSLTGSMSNASTSPTSSATVSITALPAAVEIQIQPSSAGQLDDGTQSSLQTSGQGDSTISESISTGPSATSDAVMKANEDAEKAEVKGEEGSLTGSLSNASTSPNSSATVSITAAVEIQTQPSSAGQLDDGTQSSLQTSGPGESTISESTTAGARVDVASDEAKMKDEGSLLDEQDFNMDDFVTIDEVGDDVEDTFPEPHRSSSPMEPLGEKIENQSSGLLSTGKETSTNTSKDSNTSSFSSSSSSVSPKMTVPETTLGTPSPVHLPPQGLKLKPDPEKDENTSDELTMMTRSARAKGERSTNQAASTEKTRIVGMSTRRSTRSGESQDQKTPKKQEKTPPKRNTPSQKSDRVLRGISKEDVACDVLDSVKAEVVPNDQPATKRKRGRKRGRPRKGTKRTRKVSVTITNEDQDASEKLADEEATNQSDSVEDKLDSDQSQETNPKDSDQQTEKSSSLTAPPKNMKEEPEAQVDEVVEDQTRDVEITGRELEALETLDPFVKKEDGTTNESLMETHPASHPNTETSMSLNEEKPQDEQTAESPRTGKRKHEDDTVGKATTGREEEREPACPDVFPSTPLDASSSLDTSSLSSVRNQDIQKTEVKVEAVSQAIADAASAGQELQPDDPENQTPEKGEEGKDKEDNRELVGPEAKRTRSQSPGAAASGRAPSLKSDNPKGPNSVAPIVGNSYHSHDLQPYPEMRIQLYDVSKKMLHDSDLTDPNNWGKIAMIRPGRVPVQSPYLHMDARTATEIKAESKLVTCFAVETAKPAAYSDVRVTVYDHLEGPWAEVEEINKAPGPRLMAYLVAPPLETYLVLPRGYNHTAIQHTAIQPFQQRQRIRNKMGKIRR